MDEKRVVELAIAYCRQELTAEESEELQAWLEEDHRHVELFKAYELRYRRVRQVVFWHRVDEDEAWRSIHRALVGTKRGIGRRWRFRIAAAVMVGGLLGGIMSYLFSNRVEERERVAHVLPGVEKAILKTSSGMEIHLTDSTVFQLVECNGMQVEKSEGGEINYRKVDATAESTVLVYNTLIVPRGGEYSFRFSDGTRVWLNAESELRYPVVFDSSHREVYLTGEAYFEVVRDEERPFIVKCDEREIRVLGTRFNVAAYQNRAEMVTTLLDGAVQVSVGQESRMLSPGEQAVASAGRIEVKQVDAGLFAAWASGVFEFEDTALERITEQLGRWYDVEFVYFNDEARTVSFTGAASRHGDLRTILGMIERLSKVKFIWDKDKIIVTKQ